MEDNNERNTADNADSDIYAPTLLVGGLDHGGGLPKEVVGSLAGWCSLVGQCLENFHHHYCNHHHHHDHHDHHGHRYHHHHLEQEYGEQYQGAMAQFCSSSCQISDLLSRYLDIQRR